MLTALIIGLLMLLLGLLGFFITVIFELNVTEYFMKFILGIIIFICIILILGSFEIIV